MNSVEYKWYQSMQQYKKTKIIQTYGCYYDCYNAAIIIPNQTDSNRTRYNLN